MSNLKAVDFGEPRWYAISTRSRHEKYVRDQLLVCGVEPFLPLARRVRQWKDRKKVVDFPLFPGYCFARFRHDARLTVLRATGVVRIVGRGGTPEPIPDEELEAVMRLIAQESPYDAHPYLQEGTRVRILRGPLEGLEGVLLRRENRDRVVLSVHIIRQAVGVEVDADDLCPV